VVSTAPRLVVGATQLTAVKRRLRFSTCVVDTRIFLFTSQFNRFMVNFMELFYANIALFTCNLIVLCTLLIARARVVSAEKSLRELDWETLANLTGDMATVKKTIQKLNNRLNGMEAKDPYSVLQSLQQQANVSPNVQPIRQTPKGG